MASAPGIVALEARSGEGLAIYREVLRGWADMGLPWDRSLCAIDMAAILDPSEAEVVAAGSQARAALGQLGARPFLARLDAALNRPRDRSQPVDTPAKARQRASGGAPATGSRQAAPTSRPAGGKRARRA